MVLYFSATGNTEFIAKELAAQIKNGERIKLRRLTYKYRLDKYWKE